MPDAAKKIKLINWCWSGDAGYRLKAKQTRHDNDKIKRQGWQWWKWQRQWRWMTRGCGCDGTAEAEGVGHRQRVFWRGSEGSTSGSCSLTRHSWRDLSTGIIRLASRLGLPLMLEQEDHHSWRRWCGLRLLFIKFQWDWTTDGGSTSLWNASSLCSAGIDFTETSIGLGGNISNFKQVLQVIILNKLYLIL